jgi:hypothetical protein
LDPKADNPTAPTRQGADVPWRDHFVRISVSNLKPGLVVSDLVTIGVGPHLLVGCCIGGANRKQNSRDSKHDIPAHD